MRELLHRLSAGDIILADGAMGTMLMQRGWQPGDAPERTNLDRPEILVDIARLYKEAGAEILLANTFGGSPIKLAQYGLDDQTEAINTAAVEAVREVVHEDAYVGVSVGPCGELLEPYGEARADDVLAGYVRQLKAVVDVGVDLICIETMTDLTEAVLAVRAARLVAPDIPLAATMTFDETPSGYRTIMGVSVEDAARELSAAGADILGSNCGYGIEHLTGIAAEFRKHTKMPLQIRPNAGLPELKADGPVYTETPEFMAERLGRLLECGVNIVGGCCGTTPEHIVAMREALARHTTPGG